MLEYLQLPLWSPYAVGVGIGLLNCLAFAFSDKPIGASTAFARTSGMVEKLFRGSRAIEKPYYRQFPPVIDWEWMLVLGIIIGSFLSSALSGEFALVWVPERWEMTFGYTPGLRFSVALLGGVIMGIGARWAGGCTSGHGISGTLQLAVSSWLAVICFFIGGVFTAMFIYHLLP
jgi:uncharacterized protein